MFQSIRHAYLKLLENKYAKYWIKEWVEPVLIAFLLAMFIRTFFLQAFKIPTGSMRETLLEGDRILVNKCIYWMKEPEVGDVIVFKYPLDKKRDFIKRLVGKPGDELTIRDGNLYRNGHKIEEPEIIRQNYYYSREDWPYGKSGIPIHVPKDAYFALGDNSAHSSDSRYWGFVPKENIRGKAFFIYWPPKRWRIIY